MKPQPNGHRFSHTAGQVSTTRISQGEELDHSSIFEPNIAPDTSFGEKQRDYNGSTMMYTEETPVKINESENLTIKQQVDLAIDSTAATIWMTTLTIYALFADDIRVLAFTVHEDDVFYGLSAVCLFFFALELVLSSWAKPGYLGSFYFWLDLIATLSLIPDVGWLWAAIGAQDIGQLQSAGKASRAGTRTSRVIRVIRLIRLTRIAKLYKNAKKALAKKRELAEQAGETTTDEFEIPSESRVGKKLSELTTKRVIILVLLMLLILPLFDVEVYVFTYNSWTFGVDALDKWDADTPGFIDAREEYIEYHDSSDRRRPIVEFEQEISGADDYKWESDVDKDDLRTSELHEATNGDFTAWFDLRADTRLDAGLSIAKTFFVCIVLTLGAIYFTKDTNTLVLYPIERMIDRVKRIARNPINTQNDDPTDVLKLEKQDEQDSKKKWLCLKQTEDKAQDYETSKLENTIVKIGSLLALGFGEAGGTIIATNMEKQGDVNPMLEGNKMIAIFGFCDIRQFTDATEVLVEGVMIFVNEIAQIVHGVVDMYQGAANKNIGDAFLLVWKFNQDDLIYNGSDVELNKNSTYIHQIADLSLASFLKIIAKTNRKLSIMKYRTHPKLVERMPNYTVKMGFGLHVGWAIEGAIGSEFKIDASYLSPNVNMASRLEAATKQYGVPILISGQVFDLLSAGVQKHCRKIDRVTVKGSKKPMRLYTPETDTSLMLQGSRDLISYKSTTKRQVLRDKLRSGYDTSLVFQKSKELRNLRHLYDEDFYIRFEDGVAQYLAGKWTFAKDTFERCFEMRPNDGPTQTLMDVMGELQYKAPFDWDGYRELTEK